MVAIVFGKVEDALPLTDSRYKTIPCYLALFILAELFEIFMAYDALRLRNVIQLVGLILFHAALIVMASLQIHQTRTALVTDPGVNWTVDYAHGDGAGTLWQRVLPFLIVSPVVIGVSWLVLIWFVRQLYYEFGWAIFHIVGANPAAKTMYQFYQVMICLLKFDFFAFVGVTMQLLILVLAKNTAEFGLTVAAIPIVLVLLIGCGLAVQREIKWLMTISLILMLAAESYLSGFDQASSEAQYETVRATLTTFTIIAFLLLFGTFGIGLRCFADFDKGLLRSTKKEEGGYNSGSALGPRVSIE
uniref:Transcription regulator n=1 Tax=Ganoderma boninense TaxID=34458 RepID=A0A5K1K0G5_9APHY|nr:Transcription regulator [Ganoderma boninense]